MVKALFNISDRNYKIRVVYALKVTGSSTQLLCLNCAHVTRESDTQFLNCVSK